ncbi:MAG: VWA domain-containing protein [Burkholderiales bacterium]|jgi:MoxR-like ATPase
MSDPTSFPAPADGRPAGEPWYLPTGEERAVFEAAWAARLPVLLRGPTGCGKTRFVEHMAWRLHRARGRTHEALGVLPIEKTGELLDAHPDFMLVVSYNPGHAAVGKALKASTRQRFVSLDFGYPSAALEAEIVAHETGVDGPFAERLAAIGARLRGSTRMGAAIRHAAAKLRREPASRRLLVVLSDGYPQDSDYGPDRLDIEYGIRDTARALADAERDGVATFCVTVDPAGHDYLGRMCPPRRYRVIDDLPALPEVLAEVYASLTGRG